VNIFIGIGLFLLGVGVGGLALAIWAGTTVILRMPDTTGDHVIEGDD
jgi:hypothetical protein